MLPDRRLLLVSGVSDDKDAAAILGPLLPLASRVIATRAHHRGTPAREVGERLGELAPELPCQVEETIGRAMAVALEQASQENLTVLVAGGLFLAAEASAVLRGLDARDLEFL